MTPREREAGELFYKFFDAFKRESEGLGTLGSRKHLKQELTTVILGLKALKRV